MFGGMMRKPDCGLYISPHRGSRGLLLISPGVMLTLSAWRRMPLLSRATSGSIYERNLVMFWTHFKRFTKKKKRGRNNGNVESRLISNIWIVIILFFNFYIDLNFFKIKARGESLVGKISSHYQNMWSPVPPLPVSQGICFQCIEPLVLVFTSKCKTKGRYCYLLTLQFEI